MKESINITTTWKPIPTHDYSHYYNLQTPGDKKVLAIRLTRQLT
jgi:hypothetical protein